MRRLAAALVLAAPAAAEPLPEILVTGRALPRVGEAEPGWTLGADALMPASRRADRALAAVPTLQIFRRSSSEAASQTAQGLTLRGLGGSAASRMAVTLDGVPQNDLFAGWVAFVPLSAAPLASARVTRGSGPGIGRGAAPGGLVALDSGLAATALSMRLGSRAAADLGGTLALAAGGGQLALSALYARGRGALLVDPAVAGPADVPARFRQGGVAGRAVLPLGPVTEVQARIAAFDDSRLRGTSPGESRAQGGDAALRLVHRGAWAVEALAYAQIRDFAMRAVALDATRTTATVTLDQFATPATGLGAGVELRPPVGASLDLAFGADWTRAEGRSRERFNFAGGLPQGLREAGGTTTTATVYAALAARPAPDLLVDASGRWHRWHLSGGRLRETVPGTGAQISDRPAPDREASAGSAAAALAWSPPGAGALTLRAAASTGPRLPTLNELHRPFRIGNDVTGANPLLRPEQLTMAELSLAFAPLASIGLELGLFAAWLERPIANVTLGTGPGTFPGVGFVPARGIARQRRNIGRIDSRGVELAGHLEAGAWRLDAALATAHARVRGGATAPELDGLRPAQSPARALSAQLGWRPAGGAEVSLALIHQSSRFEDDRNQRRLAAATTLDATARLPLARGLALSLDAENLSNAVIETGFIGNAVERATPRSVWLGLEFRPQPGR